MASEILTWLNEHIFSLVVWLTIITIVFYLINKDKLKAKAKLRETEKEQSNPFAAFQQEPMRNPIQPITSVPILTETQIIHYNQRIDKIKKELMKAGTEYMQIKTEMEDKIGHTLKNIRDIQTPYNSVVYGINSLASFFTKKDMGILQSSPEEAAIFELEYKEKDGWFVCKKCDQEFHTLQDFEKFHKGIHG